MRMSGRPEIKITIVGDASVGKSSIVHRLRHGCFEENIGSTIGAAFCTKKYRKQTYHIWDTAGQERFASLVPLYLSGSSVIIVVYDVTSIDSFEHVSERWLPYVRHNLRLGPDEKLPMLYLIANKIDMQSGLHKRVISTEQGRELADENGLGFLEVSAKTGHNADTIMATIADFAEEQLLSQADEIRQSRVSLADYNSTPHSCYGLTYSSC